MAWLSNYSCQVWNIIGGKFYFFKGPKDQTLLYDFHIALRQNKINFFAFQPLALVQAFCFTLPKCTESGHPSSSTNLLAHRLCATSQTLRLLSSEAESRYFPPGCQLKLLTQLSWPVSVTKQTPVDTSQILIVLSREPEARKGPTIPPPPPPPPVEAAKHTPTLLNVMELWRLVCWRLRAWFFGYFFFFEKFDCWI